MLNELFPFQRIAVNELRSRVAMAQESYRNFKVPQVISLQAPTGSGKTIIMASLMEDIFCGTENFPEEPDAIFVWLSDSPDLNLQSKNKIDTKADRISLSRCVMISDENFNQEMFDEGFIYFLNTQKLGKAGNLSRNSDSRQYTIWQTIENTARNKKMYFIIDEAHRGMQGRQAGIATTIMQRFIKGSKEHNLSPVPVLIGMSATAARFNALVGDTTSSLQKVVIKPSDVRSSGLLKERIILTYPEDPSKHSDMTVLQAAVDEWKDKCRHWAQYSRGQHEENVKPVLVIQVAAGNDDNISATNLEDVVSKIEERLGSSLKENEIVHTFGSHGTLVINGLKVHHVAPDEITEDNRIRVVLFKENLSTGWDCPRAETMMSFRRAEDATYIAQLLGRMIRTPLQRHILVDDSLNEVRLFLPYFDRDTVQSVVDELQNEEGGEIPAVVDGESLGERKYETLTVHTRRNHVTNPSQILIPNVEQAGEQHKTSYSYERVTRPTNADNNVNNTASSATTINNRQGTEPQDGQEAVRQRSFPGLFLDREAVIKFINEQGFLTYIVRNVKINGYLKSLFDLAGLLTQYGIYYEATNEVKKEVTDMIRAYVEDLHKHGKYDELSKQVLELKMSVHVFDVFGEAIHNYELLNMIEMSDTDLDRQLRIADSKMGNYGFSNIYGRRFADMDNPYSFKIDCILFANDTECMSKLNKYAENKFHALNDAYRKYVVNKSEQCKKIYSDIIRDGDCVSEHNFSLPETYSERVAQDGKIYTDHLLANEDGNARIKLNGWESAVLEEEERRNDFVCWFRNPPRKDWSLCIPYRMNGEIKSVYPDFLIVRSDSQLGYVLDILEPHSSEFKDNLFKAKGLAEYAEKEKRIGRVQLIRQSGHLFKRLDMAKGMIRQKVLGAINNEELDHLFDEFGDF
ncbi:MAG: DEAD/DEAH box helicase family protein [Synergistaceae bacterium]|nr:DEAD/DEAH box helicase family protein [Synergistaceae bacterium]